MRTESRIILAASLVLLVGLAACSDTADLAGPGPALPGGTKDVASLDQAVIGGYLVTYGGRTFDGQSTTFHWNVAGTGFEPDLRWFFVELPDCAPDPEAIVPDTGILYSFSNFEAYGVKWRLEIDAFDFVGRDYAITLPGDVAEGVVRGVVGNGYAAPIGEIYGPCGGFEIAGTVFVDSDGDGLRIASEPGIANVIVQVSAAGGAVDTVRTDADGRYSVLRGSGTYTLSIDTAGYPEAFNETLDRLYSPTTELAREVTVGPDSPDNDFGFTPDTGQILSDLEDDLILPEGESYRWWKLQFLQAIRTDNPGETTPTTDPQYYDRDRLLDFVASVQGLYLQDPYVFASGDELEEVYRTLRLYPPTELDKLYRELLVSELNFVSGRGLAGVDAGLHGALIAWGESVYYAYAHGAVTPKALANLRTAITIFEGINTGGGGGIDD